MLPSNDNPGPASGDDPTSPLRRFGPVVAIVAVVAMVAGFVIVGSGDDDDGEDGTDVAGAEPSAVNERPDGAISYSEAQKQALDVSFPDSCDTELGTVAIPVPFAPECFADAEDNGGATHPGGTQDSISVVVHSATDANPAPNK